MPFSKFSSILTSQKLSKSLKVGLRDVSFLFYLGIHSYYLK